jgi:isoamylase
VSQGVPMLCGGDELGRTQNGNNNAYCQDSPISWFDWDLDESDRDLLEFTQRLVAFRQSAPVLRRRRFFQGRRIRGSDVKDLTWFRPDGEEMTDADWGSTTSKALGLRLAGDAIEEPDEFGNPIIGDTLLLLLNARETAMTFKLPRVGRSAAAKWQVVLDTATGWDDTSTTIAGGAQLVIADRAMVVLKRVSGSRPAGS